MPATTIVFVGTENGLIPLAYIGQQWRPAPSSLSGKNVVGIAQPADNPATLYAAVKGYGLYKTEDNGVSWRQILSANAHSLLLDATNSARLWVGLEPAGVQRSLDGGQTWQDLSATLLEIPTALDWTFPDPPYQARVRVLAQVPGQPNTLLAGIEIGGLIRSVDGGDHWTLSNEGLDEDVHALAVHPREPDFWLAATGNGPYISQDEGRTWHEASEEMSYMYTAPAVILHSGVYLTAATSTPPGNWVENVVSVLYRSADRTASWQAVDLGQPEYITALARDAAAPKNVYAGVHSGAIYLSKNQGQSWEKIAQLSGGVNTIVAVRIG